MWSLTIPEPHHDLGRIPTRRLEVWGGLRTNFGCLLRPRPRNSTVTEAKSSRGSDQFGVSPPSTRTHLGRSRSSSTPRTTFSRPGTPSRTALRRATATWGPRRRRGAIWAAPATMALTTSPSPIRAQPRRPSAMLHTQPSRRSRAGPNIDVGRATAHGRPPHNHDGFTRDLF